MKKKVVIIVAKGFDEREFYYPFFRLQEAGLIVDVATMEDVEVEGKYGMPAVPTVRLDQLEVADYVAVVIPGGHQSPDLMRQSEVILAFVRKMSDSGRVVSSTCHGPWVMVSAGVVKGRKLTCYRSCRDDLINAQADYLDQPVVVDDNFITAQHYRDNPEWMRATLKVLETI